MYVAAVVMNVVLIAIDQLSKALAYRVLRNKPPVDIIGGVIDLRYVENQGAAFGIMQGFRWFFVVLTIPLLVGIVYYYIKLPKEKHYGKLRFALMLISAGAVGNFIDRLRNGYVVDFFHTLFIEFPVFNMADIYVVCGTVMMVVVLLFFIKEEGRPTRLGETGGETHEAED